MARSASTTAHDPTGFFKVSEEDFDQIFGRIQEAGIPYGSGPRALEDMSINHRGGGRGVYFRDPNDHILELLTVG
jgi:catechol 2,3-dioxygenase-like lactoylglutathione lyase family enzyme